MRAWIASDGLFRCEQSNPAPEYSLILCFDESDRITLSIGNMTRSLSGCLCAERISPPRPPGYNLGETHRQNLPVYGSPQSSAFTLDFFNSPFRNFLPIGDAHRAGDELPAAFRLLLGKGDSDRFRKKHPCRPGWERGKSNGGRRCVFPKIKVSVRAPRCLPGERRTRGRTQLTDNLR